MADNPQSESVMAELTAVIGKIAAPGRRPISPETELYYDLGVAGDDLYEVIEVVHARFGTDFSAMELGAYAPGETEALFSFDPLRELLGRPRRYRSLTVQLLAEAVQVGKWRGG